jgi:hypothetical protein
MAVLWCYTSLPTFPPIPAEILEFALLRLRATAYSVSFIGGELVYVVSLDGEIESVW